MPLRSINPYDGSEFRSYDVFTPEMVEACVAKASEAMVLWHRTDFRSRAEVLFRMAELLERDKQQLAEQITLEMGKPIRQSRAELEKCAWVCRHYAEHGAHYLAPEKIVSDAGMSEVRFQPLGVILGVMPWNFPFWQVFRFLAPVLMGGNAALLKHASNVPGCSLAIEALVREAGVPEGLFRSLLIRATEVDRLLHDRRIAGVSLTGSESAGRAVARAAGEALKPSLLELGGSNAFIVLKDADLEKAVHDAMTGRFQNSGQSCIAAKRLLVQEEIYEGFRDRLTEQVRKLKVGDPMEESTEVGPLARPDLAQDLHGQVLRTLDMGAKALAGCEEPRGAHYTPSLVEGVKPGMPLFDEESFGPVAVLCRVKDLEEAIQLSNRSKFGLGVSVYTADVQAVLDRSAEFEEGAVFINHIVKSDPRLPFGGVKASGYGRELGREGILHFMNRQTVFVGA